MNGMPLVIEDTPAWALVRKPHGMPSAPLSENEDGTLLSWFLAGHEECRAVRGRKAVEHGLVHRLDTATEGLVLIAKTQDAYDFFLVAQNDGYILKTYFAYCSILPGKTLPPAGSLPLTIRSRFRAFGPGRKEVRPLFPAMRGYDEAGKDYQTIVEKAEMLGKQTCAITCTLKQGYRHQVRAHLSWLGFPIIGDNLYNPAYRSANGDGRDGGDSGANPAVLELHAIGISFPDPLSARQASFLLPRPDRTTP